MKYIFVLFLFFTKQVFSMQHPEDWTEVFPLRFGGSVTHTPNFVSAEIPGLQRPIYGSKAIELQLKGEKLVYQLEVHTTQEAFLTMLEQTLDKPDRTLKFKIKGVSRYEHPMEDEVPIMYLIRNYLWEEERFLFNPPRKNFEIKRQRLDIKKQDLTEKWIALMQRSVGISNVPQA